MKGQGTKRPHESFSKPPGSDLNRLKACTDMEYVVYSMFDEGPHTANNPLHTKKGETSESPFGLTPQCRLGHPYRFLILSYLKVTSFRHSSIDFRGHIGFLAH